MTTGINLSAQAIEELSPLLWQWKLLTDRVASEAKPLIEQEQALRKQIFGLVAPMLGDDIREGVNTLNLPEDWVLKATYKLTRTLDQAQFKAVFEQLPEGTADRLLRWTPALETRAFKELPADQKTIFEQCVITKPASPVLELHPPKPKV